MKTITLDETVGIENIRNLYYRVVGALEENDDVVLDFAGVRHVDLTVKQVLITCLRRARKRDVNIRMINMSGTVRDQLDGRGEYRRGGGLPAGR